LTVILKLKKEIDMIEVNSTLAPFTLNDQFGEETAVEKMPKILICSFGKESGKLISDYFNAQDANYLENHDIKLFADVAGIPSLLRKTIILPKMKKYSFKILLSDNADFSKQFPKEEESLTVLKIENNSVNTISFVKDEASLKASIEN
jgi:hypothetical protein